jgi:hypothetical protein
MPSYTNDPVVSTSISTNTPAVTGEGHDFEGVRGLSHNAHSAVVGINDYAPASPPGAGGNGAWFESAQGEGVRGQSKTFHHGGVVGVNTAGGFGVYGLSDGAGVVGESKTWLAVGGFASSESKGAAVYGEHKGGQAGVWGNNMNENDSAGPGVVGTSRAAGVVGESSTWVGVYGETKSSTGGTGVWGEHKNNGTGTLGKSVGGIGVLGVSETHEGVHAETKSPVTAAIAAYNLNPAGTGAAVYAKKEGAAGHAGFFDGNVWIGGVLGVGNDIILSNADCAEDFTVGAQVLASPGTVMVLGEEGALFPCGQAYDKRVAGVISGAGDYKPGIVLDKQDSLENRSPIALIGKVYCKADAGHGAIEIGDLLTTSPTLGHAMKAADPLKAFGAIIGKALRPLQEGQGLIPILVALQ